MGKLIGTVSVLALCFLAAAVPPARAFWVTDGTAMCGATGNQRNPAIVTDGLGGAIVAWYDSRGASYDIYVQRVDASGDVQWTVDGEALCTATGDQQYPLIVPDGLGGAIVTWHDTRSGNYDIYVQRVNNAGAVQWTANGVALCTATEDQQYPAIVSDGAGGAIVTWYDSRSGNYDIYAQRVNAAGAVQWTANGAALCTATGHQYNPTITSDGAGGAIVTWHDTRSGNYDIYVQRVNNAGAVQWTANGVPLCTATGDQRYPTITSDDLGGAIVAWADSRSGDYNIYVQRINNTGTVHWKANGVTLNAPSVAEFVFPIVSDGAGGAIVAWQDYRGADFDVYAQRVSATGSIRWTSGGVALCAATGNQSDPSITSIGSSEVIATWVDSRIAVGSCDIYAQYMDGGGQMQWAIDGVALCTATEQQYNPAITPDGAGGAIVAWYDYRNGFENSDIYSQSINAQGRPGCLAPVITTVMDVSGDQGGWTRIGFKRSSLDDVLEELNPISSYNVWKRIDSPLFSAVEGCATDRADAAVPGDDALSIWPIKEIGGRCFVSSGDLAPAGEIPSGTWEIIGSFAACQLPEYYYRAVTDADSAAGGIPYSVYFVSAHTVTPSIWFASWPDSGYSVDNLAPAMPLGLEGEQSYLPEGLSLTWTPNVENDLAEYFVYRGEAADFVPEPSNRVGTATDADYFDDTWDWSAGYYYKVSAVDVHGNESGFALLEPDGVTGSETPEPPAAAFLGQNFPNPFNPATKIVFGLSVPGHVSLRIYDAAGRLVRELVNETRTAAQYEEVWDGRDDERRQVASGVYFYRLEAGSFAETKKMILLK